jgi:ribosomal protein L29
MNSPKFKELKNFNSYFEIDQEIYLIQKNFFDLRIKRATNQNIKNHLFSRYKRQIAQLNLKKKNLSK